MAIKCFCDSCGKEMNGLEKCISIVINGIPHMPDLCEECKKKIVNTMYKYSGEYYNDDKK